MIVNYTRGRKLTLTRCIVFTVKGHDSSKSFRARVSDTLVTLLSAVYDVTDNRSVARLLIAGIIFLNTILCNTMQYK